MKAVVVERIGSFSIKEVGEPAIGPNDVLVRVMVTGLCRTDLKIVRVGHRDLVLPRVPGEEVVGVIERVGADVSRLHCGQRVYLYPGTSCGQCRACLRGAGNLCAAMQIMGFHRDGGFADFVCAPQSCVIPIAESLADDLAIFAEPLSCCLNSLERAAMRPGDCVGVWGSGPAGTLVRRAALAKGASVWSVEPDARRRELCGGFELPPAEGCDVAVVAVGDPAAYQQALQSLRPRGCLVLFSGLSPAAACQRLDLNAMHYLEQRVAGAYGCTYQHGEEAIRMLEQGEVRVGDMVSHRLPLSELDHALGIVERREGMKVLLYP
jgi:L-iditol 2-dehydrogenase